MEPSAGVEILRMTDESGEGVYAESTRGRIPEPSKTILVAKCRRGAKPGHHPTLSTTNPGPVELYAERAQEVVDVCAPGPKTSPPSTPRRLRFRTRVLSFGKESGCFWH